MKIKRASEIINGLQEPVECPYLKVEIDLPKKYESVDILPLGDIHMGSSIHEDKLDRMVDWIERNKNVYVILLGDLIELRKVQHGIHSQELTPEEQVDKVLHKFSKLGKQERILASVRGNHECLSEDTEILTKEGWKNYKELSTSDFVLTLDENGNQEWQKMQDKHTYPYEGDMYHVTSNRLDMLLTPNHRVLYKTEPGNLIYKEISEIPLNTKTRKRIPIAANGSNIEYSISDNELRAVAWALTDSCFDKSFVFYQSEPKQRIITRLFDELEWSYSISKRERAITHIMGMELKESPKSQYEIHLHQPYSRQLYSLLAGNKHVLPTWIGDLSQRQFDIFLTEYISGDGSVHKSSDSSRMIYTSNKSIVDGFQEVLPRFGYACTTSEYRHGHYRINICPKTETQIASRDRMGDYISSIEYNGIVWCITVDNGNFLARRNGKVFFTGNSRPLVDSGLDPSKLIAKQLNAKFLDYSGFIEVVVKQKGQKKYKYILYVTHGASGAQTKGGKINAMHKLSFSNDADCFITGHLHEVLFDSNIRRVVKEGKVYHRKQLFVMTGSWMKYEGSYADMKQYQIGKIGCPKIKLFADRWDQHVSV